MSTEIHKCSLCGREFSSGKSLGAHKSNGHNDPWMDESKLREEYVKNGRTMYDLGEEWGCDPTTVANWLDEYDIQKRHAGDYHRVERVIYTQHEQGYEVWKPSCGESRGKTVFIHRLMAVAKYGYDEVAGKQVHHKNKIPWDNRPENIELMTSTQHAQHHYEQGDLEIQPGGIQAEMENSL